MVVLVENMEYAKASDFGFDLILGFRQGALRDNWAVDIVEVTPELQKKETYDRFMRKHKYHGAFLMGFALKDPWMQSLSTTTVPTVLLDNYISRNENVAYIGTDSHEGIDMAIEHLEKLGHKKIALLNGSMDSMVTTDRTDAYVSSMKSHGLEYTEDMIAYGYYVEESAKYHTKGLLDTGATAIICGNDLLGIGVIKECERLGLKVPDDISVIGFDNLPISKTFDIPLTTIGQDRLDLGKNAYAGLYWLVQHVPISKSLLRPQLIIRESTSKHHQK